MRPISSVQMWARIEKTDNSGKVQITCQAVLDDMTVRFKIYDRTSLSSIVDLDLTASALSRETATTQIDESSFAELLRIEANAKAEAEGNALVQIGAWRSTIDNASELPASP
jgi:hypothetical protein